MQNWKVVKKSELLIDEDFDYFYYGKSIIF